MKLITLPNGSEIMVRDMVPEDTGFILRAMQTSLADFFVEQFKLNARQKEVVLNLLSAIVKERVVVTIQESAVRLVACDPDDPNMLHGFVLADLNVMHYLYTKYSARRMGISTVLIKEALLEVNRGLGEPLLCSSWGFLAPEVAPKWSLIYSPLTKRKKNK